MGQRAGWRDGTVRKALGVFASVRKCILVNAFRGTVELPRQALAPRRYLDHQQVRKLAEKAGDDGKPVVLVLAYCGLRTGELSGLRVGDVQVKRRRLLVERSVTEVNGKLE